MSVHTILVGIAVLAVNIPASQSVLSDPPGASGSIGSGASHAAAVVRKTMDPGFSDPRTTVIRGIVVDSVSRDPLVGANIYIIGTERGTITDGNGRFALRGLEQGAYSLRFTFVGYESAERSLVLSSGDSVHLQIILSPEEIHTDLIVVTGTRTLRSISDVPVRVEAIPEEEIEEKLLMTPSNVAMLLNESTGMRVQSTSAASGTANLRIQGLTGDYTQLLNDGFPSLGGMTASLSLTQLVPLDLRQVEILKGATSSLYGSDAIAGVVNFLPKRPGEHPEVNLLINGTTQEGFDAAGFISENFGETGINGLASYNVQSRFDVDNDGFSDVPSIERITLTPRVSHQFSPALSGRVGLNVAKETREGGAMDQTGGAQPYRERTETLRGEVVSQIDWQPSDDQAFVLKLAWLRADRDARFGGTPFQGVQTVSYADVQYSLDRASHNILLGTSLRIDDFDEETSGVAVLRSYRFVVPSLFVQDEIALVEERLSLLAGIRADFHNVHGTFFIPRASVIYRPSHHLSLRLGGGTGYKAPTIFIDEAEEEGFRNTRLDPNAGPATARSASFDVNWRNVVGPVSVDWNAALFFTRLTSALIADDDSVLSGTIFLRNATGPIKATGGETSLRLSLGNLKLSLGYTYLYATQDDREQTVEVDLNPRHSFGVVLVWESHEDQIKMGLENYWTGKQRVEGNPFRTVTPSYWITGFLVEKGFGNFRLYVNFENIFDTRQTRYEPIFTGDLQTGDINTLPIYAPLEGRVINAGIRFIIREPEHH